MAETTGTTISTDVAVTLLMITPPVFLEVAKKGWFKPVAPNQWRLVDVVQGYVRYLEEKLSFASMQELADEFGCSTAHIKDLVEKGHLPTGDRMATKRQLRFNRPACRRAYSKYEAGRREEVMQTGTENRVRDARARDLEIKSQVRMRFPRILLLRQAHCR